MNNYDLFLSFGAVVEINKSTEDLTNFITLIKELGLTGASNIEKIEEDKGIFYIAQINGIKDLCFEYQVGKGLTMGDKGKYLEYDNEMVILTVDDLAKATNKLGLFNKDYTKVVSLVELVDNKLEILDNFCDMYDWLVVGYEDSTFNIIDTQLDKAVEEENIKTLEELVNRVVGRAIDYFRDEMTWDEDDHKEMINYGKTLYNIAKKYKKNDKWEQNWLESFKKELEEM